MSSALRTAARAAPGGFALLCLLMLAGCSDVLGTSPPHAAPANPSAEAGEGRVELEWDAVTDAESYVIRWTDQAGDLVNEITDIEETSFVHTGLTNFLIHRYRIVAETSGGRGPESLLVTAVPGPLPGTVEWAAVVNKDPGHEIHYAEATNATGYRILVSAAEDSLEGRRPLSPFIEDAVSPLLRPTIPVLSPSYYRVIAMNDSRIGFGGPIIVSPTHVVATIDVPRLGAAFGDTNDDTCLDLVSAVQTRTNNVCTGAFTARDLTAGGLAGLVATGRTNGDSRFADFNGDGNDDLFSSTASLATAAGSTALMHLNQANGNFQAAPGVTALGIGGFGGTLLAADFNNDGDVDVFAPNDHTRGDGARNWLLLNDGAGVFTDIAAAAGVESNPAGAAFVPRGGQAADFNEDGFIDLIFGSRLLTNDGDGTFTDGSAAAGIPVRADQGLKLIDADLDGDLDLIHHDGVVTRLHRNNAGVFDGGATIFEDTTRATTGFGLNVCDVNSDGFEDVLIANNVVASSTGIPKLLVNVNGAFIPSALPKETAAGTNNLVAANDLIACGELERNGVIDIVARWGTTYRVLRAASPLSTHIEIRVLGGAGERNQQGRIVRITPRTAPQRIMTRVVESGSGLQSQNHYDLQVGAPWPGVYDITVRFADGEVTTTAEPGDDLTIFADGRVQDGLQ